MDLTPKQQTSEAIRQAETILILTGQHPSVDQVTAVMALAAILRKFGKTVTPVVSDNPPASVGVIDIAKLEKNLGGPRDFVLKLDVTKAEVDKLRYEVADGKLNIYLTPFQGGFAPSDVTFGYGETNINYDLAIILGVPTRARVDRIFEQNSAAFESIPVVNLDFHRSNENYGAVNLIEPNASSLCEMLVALSESLQSGIIDADIATALLMGIVASTDRFTAAHTSPKSLTVAAQMMAAGARQQNVVRALYRDGKAAEGRGGDRGGSDRGGSDRGDRGGAERSDRGTDRSGERAGDRGDRERGAERAPRGRDGERQPSAAAPSQPAAPAASHQANAPAPAPQAQAPAPAPQPQLEPQAAVTREPYTPVAPAAAALAVASHEPEPPQREESYDDVPIIQPGHIEMSVSEPSKAEPADQPAQAPAQPAERPQRPMADFAAASEMFSRAQNEPKPDRDAS